MRSVIPVMLALADVTDPSRMTQSHPTAPFKAAYEPLSDSKKPCREEACLIFCHPHAMDHFVNGSH